MASSSSSSGLSLPKGSPSPSSSSPSSSIQQWSLYDVFLSFSGTDTRTSFTSHLLDALNRNSFSVFHDETKLKKGEDIVSQLPKAISESRVAIVVFSKYYAASGWCLEELVKIMDCKKDLNQIVLPIFYDVDPADVRGQRGFYEEAFKKHEDRYKGTSSMEKVGKWKEALTQAANLSGWHLQKKDEVEFIKTVVNEVTNRLDYPVRDRPVRIGSCVQEQRVSPKAGSGKELIQSPSLTWAQPRAHNILGTAQQKPRRMFKWESDDLSLVAMWGDGEKGSKREAAKALFYSIRDKYEDFFDDYFD